MFDAEATLAAALAAMSAVVAGLRLDASRTIALVVGPAPGHRRRGIPRRARHAVPGAHETVGAMVRRLAEEARDFQSLSAAEWTAFSPLFQPDVVQAITPASAVAARRTPQSTNPAAVSSALAETRAWVAARA